MKHTTPKFFACIGLIISTLGVVSAQEIQEYTVNTENVDLFVRAAGAEDALNILVAINGGPGQSSHYMRDLEQLAGENLKVVTYDQRGTGQSSVPTNGYSLDRFVEDLEAIRESIGVEKWSLLGHSYGGIIAQKYAATHPENLRSLVLMGSGPPLQSVIAAAQGRLSQRIGQMAQEGKLQIDQSAPIHEILMSILPAYFYDPEFPIPAGLRESSFHQEVSQQTNADAGAWDFREPLSKLSCPVLFIWGEDDPFGKEMAQCTLDALSSAEMTTVYLEKCGHYWHEQGAVFMALLKKFIDKGNLK